MTPLPPEVSTQVQRHWQAQVRRMLSGPRKKEFDNVYTITVTGQTFQYRQMQLSNPSPTYSAVSTTQPDQGATDLMTTLHFTMDIKGTDDDGTGFPLYIAMHGGGSSDTNDNDDQWKQMKNFYQNQIAKGVYVAVRGIGNSWDMHFQPASYILIEKLIENMILFQDVDSNRVYLLGFSAGGDGVYREISHFPQRFAAANAGGGHPGDITFQNLMNTPLWLQVGEYDSSYSRCQAVAQAAVALDNLRGTPNNTIYPHDVFIHQTSDGAGLSPTDQYDLVHWSWESPNANLSSPTDTRPPSTVINDHTKWAQANPPGGNLSIGAGGYVTTITNAIDWLTEHTRDPLPKRVYWDTRKTTSNNDNWWTQVWASTSGRGEDGTGRSQHYWLDINQYTAADVGDAIEVQIEKADNAIHVLQAKTYLRILLRAGMLDLKSPITVKFPKTRPLSVQVNTDNLSVIRDTLCRNDPNLIFTADIVLTQDSLGHWNATTTQFSTQISSKL